MLAVSLQELIRRQVQHGGGCLLYKLNRQWVLMFWCNSTDACEEKVWFVLCYPPVLVSCINPTFSETLIDYSTYLFTDPKS